MRLGVVVCRAVARGEKTAEDQGVPWTKTRVCGEVVGCSACFDGGERRAYLISQLSWWKVDGRGIIRGGMVVVDGQLFVFLFLWGERMESCVLCCAVEEYQNSSVDANEDYSYVTACGLLISRLACCALIGQFEFKCYVNWSSRSTRACRHTSYPHTFALGYLLLDDVRV